MRPILFNIGGMPVQSFFFMIMVGVLAAAFYCYWISSRAGLRREIFLDLGMIGMVCGVLGARLFHILVEAPDYYLEDPMRVFQFGKGGFVSYGAYIGGTISVIAYLYLRKLEILKYADFTSLCIPIIQFCIRVACLLAGCCYGKPTDVPWAITFTNPASTAHHYFPNLESLHPVQIYSALHAILLFVFINLFYFKKKNRFPGQCISVMFIAYFIPRGIIEFWRGDVDRGLWFGDLISTGQIVGIIGTLFFILLYFYFKRRSRNA